MAENCQHLKHGKALCGKVFGRFVETFNALVDFMQGLSGDADGKNGEGHITYDRRNNIIRCDGCGGKGGSGGGGIVTANDKSCFRIESREGHRFIVDCFYNAGGVTKAFGDFDIEHLLTGVEIVIFFSLDKSGETSIGSCTPNDLNNLQRDANQYVLPLYIFSSAGNLKTDLRTAPHVQIVEVL